MFNSGGRVDIKGEGIITTANDQFPVYTPSRWQLQQGKPIDMCEMVRMRKGSKVLIPTAVRHELEQILIFACHGAFLVSLPD